MIRWLLVGLGLPLLVGCGDNLASVRGTVTLDGKPIAGGPDLRGTVTFYPTGGDGTPAVGIIDANGGYEMSRGSDIGVPPGTYGVAITATRIVIPEPGATPSGRPMTPRRYASSRNSGFTADVKPGSNTFDFELHSEAAR